MCEWVCGCVHVCVVYCMRASESMARCSFIMHDITPYLQRKSGNFLCKIFS